jgi:hypothetical protein
VSVERRRAIDTVFNRYARAAALRKMLCARVSDNDSCRLVPACVRQAEEAMSVATRDANIPIGSGAYDPTHRAAPVTRLSVRRRASREIGGPGLRARAGRTLRARRGWRRR